MLTVFDWSGGTATCRTWHDRADRGTSGRCDVVTSRRTWRVRRHPDPVLMPRALAPVALLCATGVISACSPGEGDCNARIGFDGNVYRPHNALNQEAAPGESLGNGDVLDCDGSTVGHAKVFAVRGVDATMAVLVKEQGGGIYVAEGVPRSAWPAPLRQP